MALWHFSTMLGWLVTFCLKEWECADGRTDHRFYLELLTRITTFIFSHWKILIHVQLVQQDLSGLPGVVVHILYQGVLYLRNFLRFSCTHDLVISFTPGRIVRSSISTFLRMLNNIACRLILKIIIIIIIIINIKDWTLWSVPSPQLQLLAPTLLRSSNCSLSLQSVVVWFQRDSVLWHSLQVWKPVPSVFIYLV